MNPYICKYCNRKCRPVAPERYDVGNHWRCDYHGQVVVQWVTPTDPTNEWYTLILFCYYKDTKYAVKFYYNNINVNEKFRVERPKPRNMGVDIIASLDFHPDITPENVTRKLPTLILFS